MACWVEPGRRLLARDLRLDRRLHQEQRQRRRRARRQPDHGALPVSGPVGVKGAEPGDLLVVDLLDIGAKPDSLWGFNGFFSKKNGGGFLTDHFPQAQKSIWDFHGMFTQLAPRARRRASPGLIHPGLIGCLPDKQDARDCGTSARASSSTPTRPRAGAGQSAVRRHRAHGQDERRRARPRRRRKARAPCRRASTAATATSRTCRAARRSSSRSTSTARGLSVGDLHFSQGDGEITFCGAIEMAGWVHMRVSAHQGRHGEVRHQEPDLQAQPDRAAPTTTT